MIAVDCRVNCNVGNCLNICSFFNLKTAFSTCIVIKSKIHTLQYEVIHSHNFSDQVGRFLFMVGALCLMYMASFTFLLCQLDSHSNWHNSESNWHKRKVKEAIYIRQRAPTMNRDQGYHLPAIYNQIIPPKSEATHVTSVREQGP